MMKMSIINITLYGILNNILKNYQLINILFIYIYNIKHLIFPFSFNENGKMELRL